MPGSVPIRTSYSDKQYIMNQEQSVFCDVLALCIFRKKQFSYKYLYNKGKGSSILNLRVLGSEMILVSWQSARR